MSTHKSAEKLSEQEVKEAFVNVLSGKMSKADWHYEYSDDYTIWNKGTTQIGEIKEDLKLLSRLDGGIDEAKKLWERHVPPHSVEFPLFFSKPQLMNSILNGIIMKADIPEVHKILKDHEKNGNRFVAIESDPLTLPKNRFIGFPSAIEAKNFSYEKSTLEEPYVVHSIANLQKEIQIVLDPTREQAIKDVAERLLLLQQESNRSRGQEMSR